MTSFCISNTYRYINTRQSFPTLSDSYINILATSPNTQLFTPLVTITNGTLYKIQLQRPQEYFLYDGIPINTTNTFTGFVKNNYLYFCINENRQIPSASLVISQNTYTILYTTLPNITNVIAQRTANKIILQVNGSGFLYSTVGLNDGTTNVPHTSQSSTNNLIILEINDILYRNLQITITNLSGQTTQLINIQSTPPPPNL